MVKNSIFLEESESIKEIKIQKECILLVYFIFVKNKGNENNSIKSFGCLYFQDGGVCFVSSVFLFVCWLVGLFEGYFYLFFVEYITLFK